MAEGNKRGRKPGTKNAPKNDKNEEVRKLEMTSPQLSFTDVQKKWEEIYRKKHIVPFSGGSPSTKQANIAGLLNTPFIQNERIRQTSSQANEKSK